MDQFDRMKEKHPDALLLFRTGSTYEIYRQDAKKVSEILGTPVSTRTVGKEKNVDVASFQHEALDTYLPRLVRAGMRVAICEQLEEPKQKKKEQEAKHGETTSQQPINKESDMPRKKKEKTPQEEWKTQARMTPGAKVDLTPEAKIGLTPLSKIKMTPVDIEPAGDFICIFGFRFGRRGIKPKKHEYKVKKHSPVSRIGNGNKKHQQCF